MNKQMGCQLFLSGSKSFLGISWRLAGARALVLTA